MKLPALRMHDDELRRRLAVVREALAAAVLRIEAGERATADRDATRERGGGQGAYRDIAAERVHQWEEEIAAGEAATKQRVALRSEEAALLDELEKTRLDTERAGVRRNVLPVLDTVPAASPCSVRWDEMNGDGDARECPRCGLRVLSLAMLEPVQAEKLLADSPGAGTGLRRRADGTFVVRDCPVGVESVRRWTLGPVAFGGGFAVIAVVGAILVAIFGRAAPHDDTLSAPSVAQVATAPEPEVSVAPLRSPQPNVDPAPPELRFIGATNLSVRDKFETLGGGHDSRAWLTRNEDGFFAKVSCRGDREQHTQTIPTKVVDAFLRALERGARGDAPVRPCDHTDDYPTITVMVVGATHGAETLRVNDCSYQWHVGSRTLLDVADGGAGSINATYGALADALGLRRCGQPVRSIVK